MLIPLVHLVLDTHSYPILLFLRILRLLLHRSLRPSAATQRTPRTVSQVSLAPVQQLVAQTHQNVLNIQCSCAFLAILISPRRANSSLLITGQV